MTALVEPAANVDSFALCPFSEPSRYVAKEKRLFLSCFLCYNLYTYIT
jgi:hypothetical protein